MLQYFLTFNLLFAHIMSNNYHITLQDILHCMLFSRAASFDMCDSCHPYVLQNIKVFQHLLTHGLFVSLRSSAGDCVRNGRENLLKEVGCLKIEHIHGERWVDWLGQKHKLAGQV